MSATEAHTPVLLRESLDLLRVVPGGRYCDATVGGGGHARRILCESAPDGRLLAIDRDPEAIERCTQALADFGSRVTFCQGSFADVARLAGEAGLDPLDGVLADLGVSSFQLSSAERGFSFALDGPLDMRMDPTCGRSAADLISSLDAERLARLIREYGEERYARRVARAIKRARREKRLRTTQDLREVVTRAVRAGGARGARGRPGIDPATRTFQALRIAVNDELAALESFLEHVFTVLRPGGTVAVIAFHSLEDRIVKHSFARRARTSGVDPTTQLGASDPEISLLTRKPIRPSSEEVARNPRARSARLRAAERL